MEFFSFNYNGTTIHDDAVILIYKYLDFGEVLKMRMLNKFNKILIDENIITFYNKFRKNNTQLPKFKKILLDLSDKIKMLISNYNIEILRQSVISKLLIIIQLLKNQH